MSDKNKHKQTESGEFIPTYFTWQTLEGQKERANELSKKTKKKSKKEDE